MKRKVYLSSIFVVLAAYAVIRFLHAEETPKVTLSNGSKLIGTVGKSREGRKFFKFLGVPYAKPPLKQLRYEPPEPVEKWDGTLKATRYGSMCLHVNSINGEVEGDENCLFLNIFCPKFSGSSSDLEEVKKRKMPVFVYVHGGYFMAGGSNYMGPLYLMEEYIVLVTINYRLNSFGFLNTGDGTVLGNMGLKDQVMALKFIQKEIANFGGDPDKVVLWGESAGAAAVHFHMLSPMSKGLFKKAIMNSGTAIKPWSLVNDSKGQSIHFAETVGCPVDNSKEMVECLKTLDSKILVKAHLDALDTPIMSPKKIFAPSVEVVIKGKKTQYFLTEHPYDILKDGRGHRVPLLTGVNSDEGLLATARMYYNPPLAKKVGTFWEDLAPVFFAYSKAHRNVTSQITRFYFGGESNKDNGNGKGTSLDFWKEFRNLTNVFSDRWYIHSTRETVRIQSKFSPVYLYYFSYPLERGMTFFYDLKPPFPLWTQIGYKLAIEWWNKFVLGVKPVHLGSCHGDELVLLYNFPMTYIDVGQKDYELSRLTIQTFVQFAYDETQLTFRDTPWAPVTPSSGDAHPNLTYMHIGSDLSSTKSPLIPEPFAERMAFWDRLNLPWKYQ